MYRYRQHWAEERVVYPCVYFLFCCMLRRAEPRCYALEHAPRMLLAKLCSPDATPLAISLRDFINRGKPRKL